MRYSAGNRAADPKGLKVRGPARQVTQLLDALGAIPVGLPLPQIPEAPGKHPIGRKSATDRNAS